MHLFLSFMLSKPRCALENPHITCLLPLSGDLLGDSESSQHPQCCTYICTCIKAHSNYCWMRWNNSSSRIGAAGESHSTSTPTPHYSPQSHEVIVMPVKNLPLFATCFLVWLTHLWAFLYIYALVNHLLVDILLLMCKPKRKKQMGEKKKKKDK